jgi:5'-methylthioadenosine phosphorylase
MAEKRVCIIGGSGLYDMEGMSDCRETSIRTPFGDPSDSFFIGRMGGREVVFLSRHGRGHRLLPSEINYRANIWAIKSLGVEWILSVSAVGSLQREIKPLDLVLVDQFFDRTHGRQDTFFGGGVAAHVVFAHPVCDRLIDVLQRSGRDEPITIHRGGTYLNMQGPAFSTKAESLVYRSWGMQVIGMTNLSEARLAREAEICYATLAIVTDYDCWIDDEEVASVNVEMVLENTQKSIQAVCNLIIKAVPMIPETRTCGCAEALRGAIITHPDSISAEAKDRLDLLIGARLRSKS